MPSFDSQLDSHIQTMIDRIDDEMWSLNADIEELNSQLRDKATEKNRLQYMLRAAVS